MKAPMPGSWTFADDAVTRFALLWLMLREFGWEAVALYLAVYAVIAVSAEMVRVSREIKTTNEEAASIVGRAAAKSLTNRRTKT